MSIYLKSTFWVGATERAIKTFAQAVLAIIGTNSVAITSLDWGHILAVAATAALASILTSLATPQTAAGVKNVQVQVVPPRDGKPDRGTDDFIEI